MVGVVNVTTLTNRQYCIILDPVGKDGKPQIGQKKLVKGEKSFFLQPGERLEKRIQNVFVLGEDEGLILKANETFKDPESVSKNLTAPFVNVPYSRNLLREEASLLIF